MRDVVVGRTGNEKTHFRFTFFEPRYLSQKHTYKHKILDTHRWDSYGGNRVSDFRNRSYFIFYQMYIIVFEKYQLNLPVF